MKLFQKNTRGGNIFIPLYDSNITLIPKPGEILKGKKIMDQYPL